MWRSSTRIPEKPEKVRQQKHREDCMPEPSIQQDIESLHREVQQRLGSYDASAQQWQEAMSEKHKRN